ncbi:bifunctional GNAT family N-acetyltransferase/acetate--CoA ligase family protein [Kribbella shirazensis]|uniref:Acyl-CoA synthetase (NDP forming)/GNAT superfamily N-acetyltransferase n=1 Tax=Kribbella shirazensis TaxID=1105143 RepID=A0A7X5VEB1_9ACTN|nr:bifunctional GNAT family N-acetyltransferase/acetate--CoA ligase family protein [Kribbella shirazensis]NIK59206.1 acyl-CoA synthetase (NDP forming)/GNAT superfamily N-acetyltransferase [Kribbella shirazensis]
MKAIEHPVSPPDAGWDVLASDGSVVRIRPVREDDEPALEAMNQRVSDESMYLRFFGIRRSMADEYAHHLAADHDNHVAVVAEYGDDVVGIASYETLRAGEAEMAFLLQDSVHGKGIGTLLLEQLAAVARENGIERLRADTLVENAKMLRVLADSGFEQVRRLDSGVVELVLDTAYHSSTLEKMADRERAAENRSLQRLFSPRTVAVIGAGRQPGGIGHELLHNIVRGGFTGEVYAVNPHAGQVAEVPAYPSVSAVPSVVDLAVIAVPAEQVLDVLTECGKAGVGGAVVLTSGFSELGTTGRELQRELLAIARRHSIRLIGPNCLGLVNTAPDVRLNATFAEVAPTPGALAIAAQSGAVGIAVLEHAGRTGLGISEFVSLGNKVDVSGNDVLLHWWGDARTAVIGLYLESFGNPRKFGGLARMIGRTKPILVVKGGRSVGGRRAGVSHTAAAATPETAVDALFAQSGVLRMDTVEELVETARVLAVPPLPRGRRVAVVGNAGGAGILAADAAGRLGLELPELSTDVQEQLAAVGAVGTGNPVDLGAAASPRSLAQALQLLVGCGQVDSVVVNYAATRAGNVVEIYRAIAEAGDASGLPIVVNCVGARHAAPEIELADGRRLPVFPFPESAVRALAHAVRYAEWRARPQGVVPELARVDAAGARGVVQRFFRESPEGGWLDPTRVSQLLRRAGISVIPVATAFSRAEAIAAADSAGYPVALKTAAPGVLHKTDIGGVRVGLVNAVQLGQAYEEVTSAAGNPQVLVQAMAPRGTELAIGVVRDRLFGPLLMAGSGGVLTDVLADRQWRGLPLTDLDALDMLHSLRCAPVLAGYRGAKAADEEAVLSTVHRIAWLANLVPELAELDINPLVAAPSGAFAVDVRMRLTPAAPEPDWYARHLRSDRS